MKLKSLTLKFNWLKSYIASNLTHSAQGYFRSFNELGIKRECIGDIFDGERCFFACTKQTYPYIIQTLKQIKKSK